MDTNTILAKSEKHGAESLYSHLKNVRDVVVALAKHLGFDTETCSNGALLHDIGKASFVFQKTLKKDFVRKPNFVFRHEIASLFFISLLPPNQRDSVIEMIVSHHKSAKDDFRNKGLLDLEDNTKNCFELHYKDFELWSKGALEILEKFGIATHEINKNEAYENYCYCVEYCRKIKNGYSSYKGILMAADHFASALSEESVDISKGLFVKPDCTFYNRQNKLYPLSMISATDTRKHTIVTAPTGAGKTDFLIKRCSGRIFYTLPYQASINSMYERIKSDLSNTNAQIRVLHSASSLKIDTNNNIEEEILQKYIGASIKVLTPHQLASLALGTKGYESVILDLLDCDVILDEIHTYGEVTQALVLKIIEILIAIGCRIHIGTATMPTTLYNRIIELLGGSKNVYEIRLQENVLDSFNRHIIHKLPDCERVNSIIKDAICENKKILLVCNRVKDSQGLFKELDEIFPATNKMLIHSRFKRGNRIELETKLKQEFDNSNSACIVVATQVVEVSLDISFDIMITQCAPLDAMIQRFGRINRKRNNNTIGKYKDIYVVAPPTKSNDAKPYSLDILNKSFEVLPDNELLPEKELQNKLDEVYSNSDFLEMDSAFVYTEGRWKIKKLCHRQKAVLVDLLDINSAVCILESNVEEYKTADYKKRILLEIPVSYPSIAYKNMQQLTIGQNPFVVPDRSYSQKIGLEIDLINKENFKTFEIL